MLTMIPVQNTFFVLLDAIYNVFPVIENTIYRRRNNINGLLHWNHRLHSLNQVVLSKMLVIKYMVWDITS